jgi:hypothetical protein
MVRCARKWKGPLLGVRILCRTTLRRGILGRLTLGTSDGTSTRMSTRLLREMILGRGNARKTSDLHLSTGQTLIEQAVHSIDHHIRGAHEKKQVKLRELSARRPSEMKREA